MAPRDDSRAVDFIPRRLGPAVRITSEPGRAVVARPEIRRLDLLPDEGDDFDVPEPALVESYRRLADVFH